MLSKRPIEVSLLQWPVSKSQRNNDRLSSSGRQLEKFSELLESLGLTVEARSPAAQLRVQAFRKTILLYR